MMAQQQMRYKGHTITNNGKYFTVDDFTGNFLTIEDAKAFIDKIKADEQG